MIESPRGVPGRAGRPGVLRAAVGLLVILLASACGTEGSNETRRFANERAPTLPPSTVTEAAVATNTPAPQPQPVSSPGALLATRGAPERFYFSDTTELWTIGADGDDPHVLLQLDPEQGEIRSTAQAPGVAGDEIAALIVRKDEGEETARLIFLNGDGDVTRRVDRLERVFSKDAQGDLTATSVTWSPQGDLLLVTFIEGGIVVIPVDGEPSVLVPGDAAKHFDRAAWSPAGDAIAFIASVADASEDARQLVVAPVVDGAVDPAGFVVASRAGDGVSGFSWLPDGSGLVYTESSAVGDRAGGDLFSVQSDGSDPRLIASAGRAAPIAQIVDFAVSPDGGSLAYTIATPDATGERLVFHSLWVRALDGTATVPVPMPGDEAVTQLWWTAEGLVWRSQPLAFDDATPAAEPAFAIERLDPQSKQQVLFTATPEATPAASPEATPMSGGATPEPPDATPDPDPQTSTVTSALRRDALG